MPPLDLSVIIVNYNGERWLEACLTSLLSQVDGVRHEIIVVDNGSQDDSVGLLEQRFPGVRLIVNTDNVGFARANNQGIALSRGRYVLILNNDTLFHDGLEKMIAFLDQNPECAAVGPRMVDGQGRARGSWGYFPVLGRLIVTMLFLDRLPLARSCSHPLLVRPNRPEFSPEARPVDWASGACLLMRREAVEEVGPFDNNYFMYGEDVEWCYRVWQRGRQVWVLPEAKLVHYGAGGEEWRNWKGPLATVNTYKHFLYFSRKHLPAWQRLPLRLALAAGSGLRLLGSLTLHLYEDAVNRRRTHRMVNTYLHVLQIVLGFGRV